jgi:hypothetical protein
LSLSKNGAVRCKTSLKITSVLTRVHVLFVHKAQDIVLLISGKALKTLKYFCKAAGQGYWARLPGKATVQGCRARLPGKAARQGCRARLPGKAARQGCRAMLPGNAAGQGCRERLPGKAAGQDCRARLLDNARVHAMVQYAESMVKLDNNAVF